MIARLRVLFDNYQPAEWLALGAAVLTWAFLLLHDALPAINHVTQGFAAYYGAAYAVLHGGAVDLNSNLAFQGWLTQTGISVREVYQGNSPTLALLMIPLTPLNPALAETIWLVLNLVMLVGCTMLAIRLCNSFSADENPTLATRWWIAAVVPLLVGVRGNIQLGQVYILLALLALIALFILQKQRSLRYDLAAGAAIGAMILIKPFYGLLAILLVLWSRRLWAALSAVIVAGAVTLVSLPLLAGAWSGFLDAQVAISQIPWAGIPANQTLNSLTQHLFVLTPDWNPAPLVDSPWLATALYVVLTLALVGLTLWRARQHDHDPLRLWLPALALLPILAPVGEVHHEAFLILPAAMGVSLLRSGKVGTGRCVLIIVALALLVIPWPDLNALAQWGGWHGFMAYPRLYGALLLWAALIMVRYSVDGVKSMNQRDAVQVRGQSN